MFKKIGTALMVCQLLSINLYGQLSKIDSLKSSLNTELSREVRLAILNDLSVQFRFNPDSVIKYAQILNAEASGNNYYLFASNSHIGQAYKNKGAFELSIKYLFQSIENARNSGIDLQNTYLILGTVYGRVGDMQNSSEYFRKALGAAESGNKLRELQVYNNWAEAYYQNLKYDSAYMYFSLAIESALQSKYPGYVEFIRGNLGMVNLKLGRLDSAEVQLQEVLKHTESSRTSYLTFKSLLAEVYLEKGKSELAKVLITEVIAEAENRDYKEQIRDGYKLLSRYYEETGAFEQSLNAYRTFIALEDSIKDVETVRKIGNMRTEFEVGQKQVEVDLLTAEKRNQQLIIIGVGLLALVFIILAIITYRFYQSKAKINAELERLNQTKDKFFSIISHDLRGPVSSFMGISRMIKFLVKSKETDQLLEVADDIDESVDRLSALLDNLLNWAMQQQGHFPNVPEKVNLEELAEDLVRTLHTMAKGKQITLDHSIESEIHLWVDRNTTMTILRNLVNNALKFTPEGGCVTIDAKQKNGVAQINVSDTGVGIPREKLDKLFQLEDKKSTYGTSGEKGLGLGLQLVYEFVEMNQGSLQVESEEDKGTTFTVFLPTYQLEAVPISTNTIN